MCSPIQPIRFTGPKKHALERDLADAQRKLSRLERLILRAEAPAYEPDEFCPMACAAPEDAFRCGWLRAVKQFREVMRTGP